jgi:hypothetical protein
LHHSLERKEGQQVILYNKVKNKRKQVGKYMNISGHIAGIEVHTWDHYW